MSANREGAVTAANRLIRSMGPDWQVTAFGIERGQIVHVVFEGFEATSGSSWATVRMQLEFELAPDDMPFGTPVG